MDVGLMESIIIYAFITIFSIGLFSVSILSYSKSKNKLASLTQMIRSVFFIKGIILSLSLFLTELDIIITIPILAVFDFLVLFLLFIATLKK